MPNLSQCCTVYYSPELPLCLSFIFGKKSQPSSKPEYINIIQLYNYNSERKQNIII